MKTTTKQTIKALFKLFLSICIFVFGYQVGILNKKVEIKTEKVLVSDEMNRCIQNGGQFSLFFSKYDTPEGKYIMKCDIPEKNIFREEIN